MHLTPANERFIQSQIDAGAFDQSDDVINAGLDLLRRKQNVMALIDEGTRQLEEGEFIEYSRQEMRKRFADIEQNALRRATDNANSDEAS